MKFKCLAPIALCILSLAAPPAHAWSEAGHKIVATIAFRQMTPEARGKLAALLERHPRYQEDFAHFMPTEVAAADATTRQEWLFQQASIWPDMARGLADDQKQLYNHPTWHYIDIPSFLSDSDRAVLEPTQTINMSLVAPPDAMAEMNAVQAIRLARRTLAAHPSDEAQAAVWLCWLLHDIGDLHQPLHSTAMFAEKLFPQGDKGGNSVPTQQGFNLHALWDEFVGDWATFAMARRRADELLADKPACELGRAAAAQLDEEIWLNESRQLAQSTVYAPELLSYLRVQAASGGSPMLLPVRLSEEYLSNGVRVATGRVVQAGFRLGAVLDELGR